MTEFIQNPDEQNEQEVHLREYLRVVLIHKWTIAACFFIIVLSVSVYSLTATPIYKSTAQVIIEPKVAKAFSLEDMVNSDIASREYYQSQYEIIKSRPVAKKVIDQLNLENHKEFLPDENKGVLATWKQNIKDTIKGWKESLFSLLNTSEDFQGSIDTERKKSQRLVHAFLGRVEVSPIRNSQLVDISFKAKDPALAAKVANTLAESYIEFDLENKVQSAERAAQWLNTRVEESQEKVEQTERKLQKFKEQHDIVTAFSGEQEKLTAQTLSELNTQLSQAGTRRAEAQAKYNQARQLLKDPENLDTIPELLENETINIINQKEVELSTKLADLAETFGSRHPKIVSVKAQLENLRDKKRAEIRKVVNSLKNEYQVARAREASLQSSLEGLKDKAQNMNRKAVDFGVLKRKTESARYMYEMLLKRFKETSLSADIKSGNIRVVQSPVIPENPVEPNPKRNILLGAVLGLMLGVGLSFFLEYLDNTVKTPDDIKRFNIPYLAPIPAMNIADQSREKLPDLVTHNTPKSAASEAYRSLRTGLLFSSADAAPQVILITSPGPGEGKSITSANLAVTMAQYGSRTLLVDCDLRKPRLHRYLNVEREHGLTNALTGSTDTEVIKLINKTSIENLSVLTSGPVPPNPSELLGSKRMKDLIAILRKDFDRIIIDSPPVTAVTDAAVMAGYADGMVLVLRAEETINQQLQNALEILRPFNAKIYGAVLNGVPMDKDRYYYQYYYYYYYYYDEDGSGKKRSKGNKRSKRSKRSKKRRKSHSAETQGPDPVEI